ncbi:MAG: ribonuclease activity regulator RraA [SAR202 cluster bacterium]|nr:ribonuclease activity regulator RraA [Chloroflexota bacterium]MQG87419.1 ribonuclease activity regulator RraA [SAR202 cluster bacterium]
MTDRPTVVKDSVLDALSELSTATACWTLYGMGIRNTYMKGLKPIAPLGLGKRVVGRAFTMRWIPYREDLESDGVAVVRGEGAFRRAIEKLSRRDIFVLDALGDLDSGTLGDILSARVKYRGASAAVVDGAVRDAPYIQEVGLPVFVKGVHPSAGVRTLWPVDFNVPIQCGGVAVIPDDVILADDEGVVVIPAQYAERLSIIGSETEERELFIRQKVEAGYSVFDAYPPTGALIHEFDEWKKSRSDQS